MTEYNNMTIDGLYNKLIENMSLLKNIKESSDGDPIVEEKIKTDINNILIYLDDKDLDKERLRKLHLREYLPYPDYNNAEFNMDISKKLEFNVNKLYFNQQTTCGKQNFELGNHQRLLYNFMNKNTPYKSLLIFHGVGVGKTCTAVKISESFRDIYSKENNRIIVLRKDGLGQGWKNTIFDPKKGEYQCSGN